ncbi:MAG: hypothetical protein QOJ40_15 [Verrucomicrobiota bacterium]
MLIQTQRKLGAINGDLEGWTDSVREHIESGVNFILVLPKDPEEVTKFCKLFELSDDCKPRTIKQADFFLISQYIEPEAFDMVLKHWDSDHQVLFVEQIDFCINRPPRLKPFLVYSPVLGIIAQADLIHEAREALADYRENSVAADPSPQAGVYCWQKRQWELFEGR